MKRLVFLPILASLPLLALAAGPQTGPGAARGPGMGGGRGGAAPVLSSTHPADSPIADGAKATLLSNTFTFTEGATSDKDGNIFFVDQQTNVQKIMEWVFDNNDPADPTKGKLLAFLDPSGYSNGMCFDNDGNLIDCADEKNALWEIKAPFPKHADDPKQAFKPTDLKIDIIIKDIDPATHKVNPETGGKLMNGPNDVFVIPAGPQKGGMYLGDPLYSRAWWGSVRPRNDPNSQVGGKFVWFLSPDRKTITPVVTDFQMPNGIIGTADGKTLYVSDINARQTFSYTIKDDGTLADKKLIMAAGSDGMTIDSDGNLYTTSSNARTGLQIWSKEGKLLDSVPVGCANCCFGGKDGNILFICAGREVYGVKMKTHRVGPQ